MRGVVLDDEKAKLVGRLLRGVNVYREDFVNPKYYPPPGDDSEQVTRYFLVMVSMDHRLSRPNRPYEAVVDGEFYHGADLLYRLGMKKYVEDPEFYSPERLSKTSIRDVEEWLGVGEVKPVDLELRATLLRDLGVKLLSLYRGEASRILSESENRLKGGSGFIDRLKIFMAYQDPVEKKSYLLAKFLERRGLIRFLDDENREVPVDNHLTRVAVRLGIVLLEGDLYNKIARSEEFTWWEDVMLRMSVREAYKIVAGEAGIDPMVLDDFLWQFGRKCCTREAPTCRNSKTPECTLIERSSRITCVFKPVCSAAADDRYMLPEHDYLNTWYY